MKLTLQTDRNEGVRGLASLDPVLDALWWSGVGLVSPFSRRD